MRVAVFDNRGIGASSVPADRRQYTTDAMAQDALAVMDHLGWSRAHVVGHSMGGMIASRLALEAPGRVASLTLVSVTGGGSQAIPLHCGALCNAVRGALCTGPRSRAAVDLAFHFTPRLLQTKDPVTGRHVRDELMAQYIAHSKASGGQSKAGQAGHMHAVMTHRLLAEELERLAAGPFPIKVIHGTGDILAAPRHAARLAARLRCPLVLLEGAHFITRDCAAEINDELLASIESSQRGQRQARTVHPAADLATVGGLWSLFLGCFCCCCA